MVESVFHLRLTLDEFQIEAVTDASDAVVRGGRFTTDRFGRSAGAVALDGVDDVVELPAGAFHSRTGALSFALWLTVESRDVEQCIVSDRQGSDADRYGMVEVCRPARTDDLAITIATRRGLKTRVLNRVLPTSSDTSHFLLGLSIRFADGLVECYVNGTFAGSLSVAGEILVPPFNKLTVLGARGRTREAYLRGTVDDVLVAWRALNRDDWASLASPRAVLLRPRGGEQVPAGASVPVEWWSPDDMSLRLRVVGPAPAGFAVGQVRALGDGRFTADLLTPGGSVASVGLEVVDGTGAVVARTDGPLKVSSVVWERPSPGELVPTQQATEITWRWLGPRPPMAPVVDFSPSAQENWQAIAQPLEATDETVSWSPVKLPLGRGRLRLRDRDEPSRVYGRVEDVLLLPSLQTRWAPIPVTPPWGPRDSQAVAVFKGRLWMVGGYSHDPHPEARFDVWSTADGLRWLSHPQTVEGWRPRTSACLIPFRGRLWLLAGAAPGVVYNDIWSSADGQTWVREQEAAEWAPRASVACVEFGGRLWLIGGRDPFTLTDYNDIWSSEDGRQWERVSGEAPWSPRGMLHVVVFAGKMVLFGGGNGSEGWGAGKAWSDVWVSGNGREWTRLVDKAPWQPRVFSAAAVFAGQIWLIGGYTVGEGNRGDVWVSDDAQNWRPALTEVQWEGRHAPGLAVFRGRLWMLGGYSNRDLLNDVWVCASGGG